MQDCKVMQKMSIMVVSLISFTCLTLKMLKWNWGVASSWVISLRLTSDVPFLDLCLFIDQVALVFWACVSGISASVYVFSKSYMKSEIFNARFHMLVSVFVLSMLMFIGSGNLLTMLLGWDGLGVTSFLLVVFFSSKKSMNSGLLTFFINRLGDALIVASWGMILSSLQDMGQMFMISSSSQWTYTLMMPMLVLMAMTKSAQMPFSAWLPAAMAAPTPVSALVHSSTLVTAGLFVLMRTYYLYEHSSMGMVAMVVGGGTSVLAGLAALAETDLKKIIALSTLSQLGIMFLGLSSMNFEMSFFHLLSHAFFKAMLFILVGHMIHLSLSLQDTRMMKHKMWEFPLTLSVFIAGNLSLMGLPFLSGFISKDMIIESGWSQGWEIPVGSILLYISCGLTVSYTLRLLHNLGGKASHSAPWGTANENDSLVFMSVSGLYFLSAIGACLLFQVCNPGCVLVSSAEAKLSMLVLVPAGAFIWALMSKDFLPLSKSLSSGATNMLGLSWFSYSSVGHMGVKSGEKSLFFSENLFLDMPMNLAKVVPGGEAWRALSLTELLVIAGIISGWWNL